MRKINLLLTAILVPLDALALLGAAVIAYELRFADWFTAFRPVTFNLNFSEYLKIASPFILLFLVVFALTGIYSAQDRKGLAKEFGRILLGTAAGMAGVLAVAFLSRALFDSRFILLAAGGLAVTLVTVVHVVVLLLQKSLYAGGIGVRYVALIGKTKTANAILEAIEKHPSWGYRVYRHLSNFTDKTADTLLSDSHSGRCQAIFFANPGADKEEIGRAKNFSDINHLAFYYSADLFPGSTLNPIIHSFSGSPVIEVPKTPLSGWGAIYKRVFDITIGTILIVITLPLQILVVLGILLADGLPILFVNKRVGEAGRKFAFLKFRSMKNGAHALRFDKEFLETHGNEREGTPLFKLQNDPRVTRIGKFLRSWSIDEIPQFYSVVWGTMSLVGPRPHLPEEVAKYKPEERRVLTIKPGVTGLSQVSGRAHLDFEEEVGLDMHYIENWSPWLDLIIILKTPLAVILRKGAA